VVDFRRNKDGIPAKVEHIEYDPNRSHTWHCSVMRRRAPLHHCAAWHFGGSQLVSGAEAPIKAGNCLPLRRHSGRQHGALRRDDAWQGSADCTLRCTSVQLLAREGSYAQLRLRSGEIRKVHG